MKIRTKFSAIVVILGVLFFVNERSLGCGGCGNSPPVAVLTATPDTGISDVNVTLDGSGSTDDGGITKYEWDFDYNGTFVCDYWETEANYPDGEFDGITTHTYTSPGTYIAMLRVTDNASCGTYLTDTDSCVVTVRGVKNVDKNEWYSTIQAAINDANSGNHILVYPGRYIEHIDFNDISCVLTGTDVNDWDVVANTIIDANGSGNVVDFEHSEDANYVLKGFTLAGGTRGICCKASPTISNCIIENNNASSSYGGGIYNYGCSPVVNNCFIINNKARLGGGMYNYNSSPKVSNCVFSENLASGISIFRKGGGMYNINNSDPVIINCTFVNNHANDKGGGMYSSSSSTKPDITNCIFWGNDANSSGNEIYNAGSANPTLRYCDVNGCKDANGVWNPNFGTDGGGNINTDPLFVEESIAGLVSHWRFDEVSGAMAYDSAGDNDGTVYGATWTTGQINGALNFDGVNDCVSLSSKLPDMSSLTISAWVYYTGTGVGVIFMDATCDGGNDLVFDMTGDSIGIRADKSGSPLNYEGGGAVSGLNLANSWHHLVWSMSPTQSNVYVDGELVATKNVLGKNTGYHAANPKIGKWWDQCNNKNYFKGKIDALMIFDRALSVEEVEQIYEYGFTDSYHLKADSPCVNAGDQNGSYSGQKDVDGEQRVIWGRVDIGADESVDCNNTTPDAVLTAGPCETYLGDTVTLDGSGTTDGGGITKYEWDFDYNGTFNCDYWETEANHPDGAFDGITKHTYTSLGTYTVMLRVTDNGGCGVYLTDTATCMVYITSNLVRSPNFEEPDTLSLYWRPGHNPGDVNAIEEISPNGYTGKCVKMQHDDPNVGQSVEQILPAGTIEGGTYEYSAKYKCNMTRIGWIDLYDCDWKAADGNTVGKIICGRTFRGTGDWNTLKTIFVIPERDDFNEPVTEHTFLVRLNTGWYNYDDNSPTYYDNVVLRKIDPIPQKYEQIEERDDWTKQCVGMTSGSPWIEWDPNIVSFCDADTDPNIMGESSLVLHGSKTTGEFYTIILPIKPSTKYRISVKMKYEERRCCNFLAFDPNYGVGKIDTRGIYAGEYFIGVSEPNNADGGWVQDYRPKMGLLQPATTECRTIPDYNKDWFYEDSYYQSSPKAVEIKIWIRLSGFEGKFYVDALTLEEVGSHIQDRYLHIPIDCEFEGMKIAAVDANIPSIETNAAKFVFDYNSIELQKKDGNDANTIGTITFDNNFLVTLAIDRDVNGLVILENNNVTISVGADSTLQVRLENDSNVAIKGVTAPKYYNFDAGIVFATDYKKGLLFAPIYPELNMLVIPFFYDTNILDYIYYDDEFNKCGLVKNWTLDPNFSNSNWKVTYNCKGGDGFIASVFPPKDFNDAKYAKERMAMFTSLGSSWYPDGNSEYAIQKSRETGGNIGYINDNGWTSSDNNTAPENYYTDANGIPVGPNEPNAIAHSLVWWRCDFGGPCRVTDPNGLSRLASQAHEQDMKIVVYFCPEWYYTSEPNTLLKNFEEVITRCGIDGLYLDGVYRCHPLKSLELVRRTRNMLRDGYYIQHKTIANTIIRYTDRFREPFYDVYADQVWLGEYRKKDWSGNPDTWVSSCAPDPNAWGLLYCNRNLANTPSRIVSPHYRPVDYSDPNGKYLTLEPNEQIELTLKYKGTFPVNGRYEAYIEDPQLGEKKYYDPQELWFAPFDKLCLGFTYPDGVADVGETIYTARQDCAPDTNDAVLARNGNVYDCNTAYSVAQWIIDGNEPFYRLHFTFDANIASDDSDNKMSPDERFGLSNKWDPNYQQPEPACDPPTHEHKDGRKTFYFNGTKKQLFGDHDETLCFTDDLNDTRSFSSFAVIKRDSNSIDRQIVFILRQHWALSWNPYFYYGFQNSKLYVNVKDSNGIEQGFEGDTVIDSNWHTIGIVYDGTNSSLKFYLDGVKDRNDVNNIDLVKFNKFGSYIIGSISYYGTYNFKGWIDDLFVTDRALSDQQVLQYHQTLHKTLTITDVNDPNAVYCIINKNGKKYTAERQ